MQSEHRAGNPFVQLLDPQTVLSAVERSDPLAALKSRVYRPLDGLPRCGGEAAAAAHDEAAEPGPV